MPESPADTTKPLLLVDVDGVLSLFGPGLDVRSGGRWLMVDGFAHFLSDEAGEHLRALSADFECVWCTGWEERADEHLRLAYRLEAAWPHIVFPRSPAGAHWKLRAIDAHAGPVRPLAWVDDTFDESCHAWAAARPGPTLLVPTSSAAGLTAAGAETLRDWAAGVSASGSSGGSALR